VALLAAAAIVAGYFQIVTTHTDYDDEGYVMLSLASFMDGMPLYDETYTQYGPAPFLALSAFHRLSGLPVSHDVTRVGTLVLWIGASLLASVLVWRLTEHVWIAVLALVLTFLHLERLCLEPGHPQSLCTLGTIGLCVLATWWRRGRPSGFAAIAMGLVLGSILMTKSNVGVLLLASLIMTWTLARAANGGSRALLAVVSGSMLLLPFAMTWATIRTVGPILPAIVAFSTLGSVMVAVRAGRTPGLPLITAGALGCALVACAALWILLVLWSGTSAEGVWYGLVGQHLGFAQSFPVAAPLSVVAIPWAVLGTLLALVASRSMAVRTFARIVILATVVAICTRHLVETFAPLEHGLDDRGATAALLMLVTPFVWVLLVPERDVPSRYEGAENLTRVLLCMTACLQPMLAHPVPGTQMAVGSTMLVVGCLVVLHDLATARPTVRWAIAGLVATAVVTLVVRDVSFMSRWSALTPLRLPGAELLRMERDQAARYRWLARTLRTRTDTFVFAEHARDSFYFWTRLPPPTALNPTNWPRMLSAAQQHRVITALAGERRIGVVHETPIGPLPEGSPLLAYLDEHFRPGVTDGWFRVWFRKDAIGLASAGYGPATTR